MMNSCLSLPPNYRIIQNILGEYGYQELVKRDQIEYWRPGLVWYNTKEEALDFVNFCIKEDEEDEQRKHIIKIFERGE